MFLNWEYSQVYFQRAYQFPISTTSHSTFLICLIKLDVEDYFKLKQFESPYWSSLLSERKYLSQVSLKFF